MQNTEMQIAAPTAQKDRIIILDSLRGFAILGILLMNMPSFSLPASDPSIYNETGINYYVWYFINLVPDGTQRALFSMLFGAGVFLFLNTKKEKLPGLLPADYFVRRQLWLIVFSLIDVYILLWHGDILFDYACMGFILYAFRNASVKILYIAAFICLLLMMARENRDLYQNKRLIQKGEAIATLDTTVNKLTIIQKEDLGKYEEFKDERSSEKRLLRAEKKKLKINGSYEQIYNLRSDMYISDLVYYTYFSLWDILEFMLLGMAFLKTGILTGKAKTKLYAWMFIGGLIIGIAMAYFRLQQQIDSGYDYFAHAKNTWIETYNLERTFRGIGLFGLLMLLYKSGLFKWLFSIMRPVGQMAFSNYLGQSLICGIIFYGIGFGLYGKVQRYEAYLIMSGIWLFQIIFSNIWLRYFRFGPLEWAWRSLTYWKRQPMKK